MGSRPAVAYETIYTSTIIYGDKKHTRFYIIHHKRWERERHSYLGEMEGRVGGVCGCFFLEYICCSCCRDSPPISVKGASIRYTGVSHFITSRWLHE